MPPDCCLKCAGYSKRFQVCYYAKCTCHVQTTPKLPDESERLRTCGQHPTIGNVTRSCGRVLPLDELYRCGDCRTAFCRDCLRRHFQDETPEARDARWKAQIAAEADGDETCMEEDTE